MTNNHATNSAGLIAITLAIFLAPTFAFTEDRPTELSSHAVSFVIEYKNCMTQWVATHLIASATPTELANGAHSKCSDKLQEYEEAQMAEFLSITPLGQELRAREKAKSMAEDFREMTKAHIIRLIIESRSENYE